MNYPCSFNIQLCFHSAMVITETRKRKSLPLSLRAYLLWTEPSDYAAGKHAFTKDDSYILTCKRTLLGMHMTELGLIVRGFRSFQLQCCTIFSGIPMLAFACYLYLIGIKWTRFYCNASLFSPVIFFASESRFVWGSVLYIKKETQLKIFSLSFGPNSCVSESWATYYDFCTQRE